MNIVFDSSAPRLRGWSPEDDYSLSLIPSQETFGTDSAITTTIKDLTYAARTTSGTISKSNVAVTADSSNPAVQFTTDTPAVCAVDVLGRVSRLANGTCIVRARGQTGERLITQEITTVGGKTIYDAVTARATGSLRKYLYDQQIAALSGITPGPEAQRAHAVAFNEGFALSGSSVNTGNFIRAQGKAGFAALPLDALDELLVGAAGSAQWRAWISPHHFLTWRGHGSTSSAGKWVSISGEIVVEYSTATWAGTLCKLLPADWKTRLPDVAADAVTRDINIFTRHYNTYDAGADKRWVMPACLGGMAGSPYSATDARRPYQKVASAGVMSTGGDSGSPAFCGINGTLVPLGHTAYYGSVCSFWYGDYISSINSAMATLNASGVYTAQTVDLSGFNTYP